MTVDVNKPLGDLVTQNPNRAPIFDELKLDYEQAHRLLILHGSVKDAIDKYEGK